MANSPLWTIAIPTFNGQKYLSETLQSVMNQSDQGFELILCDDGSSDDTIPIAESICGNRALIYSSPSSSPLGLAGNWNRCVQRAAGDWITILHQDDLLTPDFFATHHKVAREHPDLCMITGPAFLIDEAGQRMTQAETSQFRFDQPVVIWPACELSRLLVRSNPIRCPATSFRKNAHQAVGGFSKDWKYVVDWYFWYRLGMKGAVALLNRELASQRWHQGSETQRLAKSTRDLEENNMIMRLILDETVSDPDQRNLLDQEIRERMALAWLNRSYMAARCGDRQLEWKALRQALRENRSLVLGQLLQRPKTLARLLLGRTF